MSATVLYMSMSLDGFVAGPNENVDNGLGDGGERLHEWIFAGAPTEHGGVPGRPEGADGEAMATGAVVAGRGTFEPPSSSAKAAASSSISAPSRSSWSRSGPWRAPAPPTSATASARPARIRAAARGRRRGSGTA